MAERGMEGQVTKQAARAPARRIDLGSLALLLVGLASGALSSWFVIGAGFSPAIIVPSAAAITIGAMNLVTKQAPKP
ncbi:hypothetical protein GCG21_09060 [Pseudactinotalea sp. HY160]|uniref:hypothetical protein n=1 Tax=Pseudactinotalea sp. HY160 TaxID=2654490 RepID=UPI00128BFC5F|nr:hypothetical protein [Pseudactinotalea sp. HY160]MPV50151.1 hypothetical protein [Pseudactinotalea sp. HY160]